MTRRILDRAADLLVAALVGWWSPILGVLVLAAIGHWLGWWIVGALVVAAGGWTVWAALQLPRRWMPW